MTAMRERRIDALPDAPHDAALTFYKEHEPLDPGDWLLVLPSAAHDHADWRRAAVRDLARAQAPGRVNLVAGEDGTALDTARAYLRAAPGITGQYLELAGQ